MCFCKRSVHDEIYRLHTLTEHSSDLVIHRDLLGLHRRGAERRRSHVDFLRIARHDEDDMVSHLREQLNQDLQICRERLLDDRERGAACNHVEARFHSKDSHVHHGVHRLLRLFHILVDAYFEYT